MKAFAITILALVTTVVSPAQDVTEMVLPWKPSQKVFLNLKFAESISIEAWDKKQVSLRAEVTINGGQLNHAHIMDSTINDQVIEIVTDFDKKLVPKNHWCNCDGKGVSRYSVNKNEKGHWLCSEIHYTVYLPAGTDLELETISGSIKILNMKGAIEAKSVSGVVDVIIPEGQKADVHLKSVMGRVTSNPDIASLVQGLRPLLARELNGKLNGGGKTVNLESVTGNVTLRSAP